MQSTDIIRQLLAIIDQLEHQTQAAAEPKISVEISAMPVDELARMKQIAGLASDDVTQYSNQPQERIAGIEAVTTDAGGGINGPKNPADMRSNSISMYPNHQHNPGV